MDEGLVKAVSALGEQVAELKKQLEIKDFMLEKARREIAQSHKELEEFKREDIKRREEEKDCEEK